MSQFFLPPAGAGFVRIYRQNPQDRRRRALDAEAALRRYAKLCRERSQTIERHELLEQI